MLWLVAAALWLGAVAPATGQESRPRHGFWWGLGFSYGAAWVSCDICVGGRGAGISASAAVGGTLSSSFRVGGELDGWTRRQEGVDEYLGTLSAAVFWYPDPGGGLYLKGGLGYVAFRIDDADNALTSSGLGPVVGAGYEVMIGGRVSIQPYLNAAVTLPTGQLEFNGDRQAEGVFLALLQLGMAITWH
jgi:hypothetical protein